MGLLGDWLGKDTTNALDDFGRGLLMTNDFGKGAAYGFQAMDERRKKGLLSSALQGTDPKALGILMQEDPEAGMRIQQQQAAERDAARKRYMGPAYAASVAAKTNPAAWGQFQSYAAPGMPEVANWTPETVQFAAFEGQDPLAIGKFQAETAKNDLPTDVREYQFAQSQGFKGSYPDWVLRNKRAGATNVTVDAVGDNEFEKGMAGGLAKRFTGLMDQGNEASTQLLDIGLLRDSFKESPQGLAGGMASLAQSYGIDVTGKGATQVAEAVISKLIPAQRAPGSGPMSDSDLNLFKRSLPSLWGTPQGNAILVDSMESMARYKVDAGRLAERVALGEITREQGLEALRKLPDPLARFKAFQGGAARTTSGVSWSVKK